MRVIRDAPRTPRCLQDTRTNMARPKIVEVDYFQFRAALARAADAGQRLEPSSKEDWKAWVREHDIREAAFKTMGDNMYDGLAPVIINTDDEWGGYYLVSKNEEACLKWARTPG